VWLAVIVKLIGICFVDSTLVAVHRCLYILQVCACHMCIAMEIYCWNYFGISVCLNDETVGINCW